MTIDAAALRALCEAAIRSRSGSPSEYMAALDALITRLFPEDLIELLGRVAAAEKRAEEAEEARDAAGAHADGVEDRLRAQKEIAEATEAKLAVAMAALEEISDGVGCDSKYGPGCDTHCKALAREALAAVGGNTAPTRKAVYPDGEEIQIPVPSSGPGRGAGAIFLITSPKGVEPMLGVWVYP